MLYKAEVLGKLCKRESLDSKEEKMKKFLAIALSVLMVAAMFTGCTKKAATGEQASGAAEGEKIVFKHGFDLDYPPYSYRNDDGEMGGFDVELAQAVCEYYGWEYQPVPFNWDAKDAELNAGNCDCIWSGFTRNGREDDYTWSISYSDNTQMIMVPDDSDIKTLDDLAGKVVGVQTATSAYDLLNDEEGQKELKDTFKDLKVYDTYTIAFNDLQVGGIDAIAIDVTSGNFLMSSNEGYHFLDDVLGSEQYAIGFRKGEEDLCNKVNEALMALVENGTYDAIGQKYPDIYEYLCLKPEGQE